MPDWRAEAGSRPAASDFLLLRQKKVTKEKATPSLRPLRDAKGQTCVGAVAGCAAELTARCALRSDNHGESVHEACALRRACSPRNRPAAGAASRGGTAEQPHGPLLRSAPNARAQAPCAAQAGPSAAQRSNGPCGCPLPGFPSGCAEERSGQRIRARDCLSEASSSETPLDASTAGCRTRPQGGWGRRL